jgi:Transketolase, C-terminal domain
MRTTARNGWGGTDSTAGGAPASIPGRKETLDVATHVAKNAHATVGAGDATHTRLSRGRRSAGRFVRTGTGETIVRARRLARSIHARLACESRGSDLTLVSHGYATVRALNVARRLADSHAVELEVVDLRSLHPLDVETVADPIARTNRAISVEDGWATYGVTAELATPIQHACIQHLDHPVERIGMIEFPLPNAENLEAAAPPLRTGSPKRQSPLSGPASPPADNTSGLVTRDRPAAHVAMASLAGSDDDRAARVGAQGAADLAGCGSP